MLQMKTQVVWGAHKKLKIFISLPSLMPSPANHANHCTVDCVYAFLFVCLSCLFIYAFSFVSEKKVVNSKVWSSTW